MTRAPQDGLYPDKIFLNSSNHRACAVVRYVRIANSRPRLLYLTPLPATARRPDCWTATEAPFEQVRGMGVNGISTGISTSIKLQLPQLLPLQPLPPPPPPGLPLRGLPSPDSRPWGPSGAHVGAACSVPVCL